MPTIKQLLKQKGINQKHLAIDLDLSQPTISDWINGKKEPTPENLKKLSDYFHVSVDEIEIGNPNKATVTIPITNILDDERRSIADIILERLIGDAGGELTKLSPAEWRLIAAYRAADERAQRDALNVLLTNPRQKKENFA